MASPLAEAHIEAERRLRLLISGRVQAAWRGLPDYDQGSVDQWLSTVLPLVDAGQRASVALTDSYLALALERQPLGVNHGELIGSAVRAGTPPEEVYRRPFVTVWSALANKTPFEDAVHSGMARAAELARFDVQASMRATANAVQAADDGIFGYQRVADGGACEFCLEIDGAYVKSADAMSLHPGCGCGLEPLTAPHPRAAKLPSGVAVHQHGEMGPLLGAAEHEFTGPSDF